MLFFNETLDNLDSHVKAALDFWLRAILANNKKKADNGKKMAKAALNYFSDFIDHHTAYLNSLVNYMGKLSDDANAEVIRLKLNPAFRSNELSLRRLIQEQLNNAEGLHKTINGIYNAARDIVAPVRTALALLKGNISFCLLRVEQNDPESANRNFLGSFAAQVANVKQLTLQDVPWAENVIGLIRADEKAEESKAFGRAFSEIKEIEKKLEKDMVKLEAELKALE